MAVRPGVTLARVFAALLLAAAAPPPPALPIQQQAALLTKVSAYDAKLAGAQGRTLRVLVVYRSARADVKAVLDALREVGFDAYAVAVGAYRDRMVRLAAGAGTAGDDAGAAGTPADGGAEPAGADEVDTRIDSADVLYLMPDLDAAALSELSARRGTLSVSGNVRCAEDGQCSIGLGARDDGRPQIVVNLAQAQREGHRFTPQFLTLTRIVR